MIERYEDLKTEPNKVIKTEPEMVKEGISFPILNSLKSTLKGIGSNKNIRMLVNTIFGLLALAALSFVIISTGENTPLSYLVAGYIIYRLISDQKKIKK